jgi:hypothetical protein
VRIVEVRHTVGQSLAAVGGTRAGEPISTSPAVDLDDENHAPPVCFDGAAVAGTRAAWHV